MIAKLYRKFPILRELLVIRDETTAMRASLASIQAIRAQEYLATLKRSSPRYSDANRLIPHGFQVNSQNEEDGMIAEVFRRVGTTDRVFVEIGVGDGTENNSAFLAAMGWSGFWLDGQSRFLATLASINHNRRPSIRGRVDMISAENAASVLGEMGVPDTFDLLSLDIDHGTYQVWEAIGARFKPRVVVVEYNSTLPSPQEWVGTFESAAFWDGTHRFGASLKSFELLGCRLGYALVGCDIIGTNAFFVRCDLVADCFCPPFTAENHYEPPRFFAIHRRSHAPSLLC